MATMRRMDRDAMSGLMIVGTVAMGEFEAYSIDDGGIRGELAWFPEKRGGFVSWGANMPVWFDATDPENLLKRALEGTA